MHDVLYRSSRGVVALSIVLLLCCLSTDAHATTKSAARHTLGNAPIAVHPVTLRIVDEHFREVYFHGINTVVKQFPWLPDFQNFDPATSLSAQDLNAFEQLGINAIRLGTMWAGVEPQRGVYNRSYLQAVGELIELAASYGVYTLLDMHQDVYNEKFCGEGFPDWTAIPNNQSEGTFPEPLQPPYDVSNTTNHVPSWQDCSKESWSAYYFTEATGSAFQNLYDNQYGLRDHWSNVWAALANIVQNMGSAVLGYELMNEPWAGNAVADLTLMIPGVADRVNLQPMWDIGAAAIRAIDPNHAIFFESVTWDWVGCGFTDVPGGSAWRNKSVLSYHFYIPPDFSAEVQFAARMDDMARLRSGGFLTEFYAESSVMDKCDELSQSWMIWAYKPFYPCPDGFDASAFLWYPNGSMNMNIARLWSRTYAQVVAGTTVVSRYNNNTQSYLLVFRGDSLVTSNVTKIYVNEALHYPNGFQVSLETSLGSGVTAAWWRHTETNRIEVEHDLYLITENNTVTVTITAN